MIKNMKQWLEALKDVQDFKPNDKTAQAITSLRKAIQEEALRNVQRIGQEIEQEPVAVYGYCPECGGKGVMRERRPNGNDKCANGHTYPSCKATHPPQLERNFCPRCGKRTNDIHTCTPPQQTWVGLDHHDKKKFSSWLDHKSDDEVFTAIEAKLKELNS